jgi:hypothetical protein
MKCVLFYWLNPLLWLVHFTVIYLLGEFGCLAQIQGIGFGIIFVSVILLAVSSVITYMSRKNNRAFITNVIFTLMIGFETIPVFFIRPHCL